MKKVVQTNNPKSIMVQVVLGNPRIGCDGYGICKFVTKRDSINGINPDRLIDVYLCIENEQLHLVFNKAKMNQTTYQAHFSEGIFKVETETELPETITSFFKYPPSVLERGIYKITETKTKIVVVINIHAVKNVLIDIPNKATQSF